MPVLEYVCLITYTTCGYNIETVSQELFGVEHLIVHQQLKQVNLA